MAIKKILLSKKISNVIYDIFPKTSADVVVYGESTVAATLGSFATDLANVYNKTDADAAIKASADALYNKIMGITDEDGTTVTEAYDTLKEVAAWINEHGEVAAGFITDINALQTAVGTLETGLGEAKAALEEDAADIEALQTAVEALETAVGNAESGLVKAMAEAQSDITALEETSEDHKTRIEALETAVGDAESGLVKDVADLVSTAATRTEASQTNGNIVIDDEEVVVYTHPETHAATMIVEDDDHMFVTSDEKEIINNAAAVVLVSSESEIVKDTDLYMVEL